MFGAPLSALAGAYRATCVMEGGGYRFRFPSDAEEAYEALDLTTPCTVAAARRAILQRRPAAAAALSEEKLRNGWSLLLTDTETKAGARA